MDAFATLMDALMQPDPDPDAVFPAWARVGAQGQQMVLRDANIGPKMMALLQPEQPSLLDRAESAASGALAWLEGDDEAPASSEDPAETMAKNGAKAMAVDVARRRAQLAVPVESATAGPVAEDGSASVAATGAVYLNQRDNATDDDVNGHEVHGDNMCNVTTLAMQVCTLAGGVDEGRAAAVAMLEKRGARVSDEERTSAQVEDLIYRRFKLWKAADWIAAADARVPPFDQKTYAGWSGWAFGPGSKASAGLFHQIAPCLGLVFDEIEAETGSDYTATINEVPNGHDVGEFCTEGYVTGTLKPLIDGGATIMLSTGLTGGHIALLVDVLSDGVLVDDPYGMNLGTVGKYLTNGTKAGTVRKHTDVLDHRLRENPDLRASIDAAELDQPINDLGDHVFFDWKEVAAMQIGKWNSVASRREPAT